MSFDTDMLQGTASEIASLIMHSTVNFPVSFQLFPWNTSGRLTKNYSEFLFEVLAFTLF